ncbi:MAG: DNA primase [Phycisphaeraceae bacterium]|nr:DNA primase [Phycisphaeraceae bacterium]MCW5753705.1 DNA primase [Phycisphaeraceae bacterium]
MANSSGMSDWDRVRDASDIVRVVGEHVSLRPKGREYVGLCPFHDDHNPSMGVVPAKQIFHCFVCGTGGDVFTFVRKFHKMDPREALEYLAERAGVALTPYRAGGDPSADRTNTIDRRAMVDANAFAASFYRSILTHPEIGRQARDIIAERGIHPDMVERFHLGAAPDRWDSLALKARAAGLSEQLLIACGLVKAREQNSGVYDVLRNRLIFPIHDQVGRIIAFGGRRLQEQDNPKYLNSPETRLFDKSSTLYGLFQATSAVRRTRTAIITEGYTDVIACHQAGFDNTLGTLGTALTAGHVRTLRERCDTVILLFDADEAGLRAADRAVEVFFSETIDIRVCTLRDHTDAKDPDELLKQPGGAECFARALAASVDLLEFRYRRLELQTADLGPAARQRILEGELQRLGELGLASANPVRKAFIIKRLSQIMGLSPELIARVIPVARKIPAAPDATPARASSLLGLVEHLVGCALSQGELWAELTDDDHDALKAEGYASPEVARLTDHMNELHFDGVAPGLDALLRAVEDADVVSAAVDLHRRIERQTETSPARNRELWASCLLTLRRRAVDRAAAALPDPLARIQSRRLLHTSYGGNPKALPRPPRA